MFQLSQSALDATGACVVLTGGCEPTVNSMVHLAKAAQEQVRSRCFRCQAPTRVWCACCRSVPYCGRKCQRAAWKEHRSECLPSATRAPFVSLFRMVEPIESSEYDPASLLRRRCYTQIVVFRPSTRYTDALRVMGLQDQPVIFIPVDRSTATTGGDHTNSPQDRLCDCVVPSSVLCVCRRAFGTTELTAPIRSAPAPLRK